MSKNAMLKISIEYQAQQETEEMLRNQVKVTIGKQKQTTPGNTARVPVLTPHPCSPVCDAC